MLSPAWPGMWNGSLICTPWARMQWAKLTMSRSDCAWVSWPVAPLPAAEACPGRLATGGEDRDDEHAAANTPAAMAPVSTATTRRAVMLLRFSWCCLAFTALPPHCLAGLCDEVYRSADNTSRTLRSVLRPGFGPALARRRRSGRRQRRRDYASCNADVMPVRAG